MATVTSRQTTIRLQTSGSHGIAVGARIATGRVTSVTVKRKREPLLRPVAPPHLLHRMLRLYDANPADLLAAGSRDRFDRYIVAMSRAAVDKSGEVHPHSTFLWGHTSPTVFTTLRNAVRTASEYPMSDPGPRRAEFLAREHEAPTYGIVMRLDLTRLPVIDLSNPETVPFERDDEESFCERQMLYWERRVAAVRARNHSRADIEPKETQDAQDA